MRNRDPGLLVRRNRLGEGDDDFLVRDLVIQDRFAGGHGTHRQVNGVEAQFLQRFRYRFEGDRGFPGDSAIGKIRSDIQCHVQDVDLAARRVFPVIGGIGRCQERGRFPALDFVRGLFGRRQAGDAAEHPPGEQDASSIHGVLLPC
jgi:hypothetical protein